MSQLLVDVDFTSTNVNGQLAIDSLYFAIYLHYTSSTTLLKLGDY